MQKIRKIPSKPRFDYVRDRAYWLLLELGVSEFPVSPWDIIAEYSNNIRCLSWSELHDHFDDPDPFHLAFSGADARVIKKGDQFIIVYDDIGVSSHGIKPSNQRIRWTLMHEIGHIFLLHLNHFDAARLDRGGLSDEEYGVLEIEANFFAAEMYIPTALFKFFSDSTPADLMVLCDISPDAAKRRHRALFENTYHPNSALDNAILRNFNDFIEEGRFAESQYRGIINRYGHKFYKRLLKISRKCPLCHSFTTETKAKYCTFCGYDFEEESGSSSYSERLSEAKALADSYSVFERRLPVKNDRLLICPVCLNQDISSNDNYCSVCGQPLLNLCLNEEKMIDTSFRHCPDCGSSASFELPYSVVARRISAINKYVEDNGDSDHYKYDHWSFIQRRIGAYHNQLSALLFCTKAFLTDDNDLVIYTDDPKARDYIIERADIITSTIRENETFEINKLEVITTDVL